MSEICLAAVFQYVSLNVNASKIMCTVLVLCKMLAHMQGEWSLKNIELRFFILLKALPVSYNIKEYGDQEHSFRVRFPFSWLIKEQIDAMVQLPNYSAIYKGLCYSEDKKQMYCL